MTQPITPEIAAKIHSLRAGGLSQEAVMERLGVSHHSVLKHQPKETRSGSWSDEELKTLNLLWPAGHSADIIARVLPGRSRCSVLGKVHRLGLTRDENMNVANRANGKATRFKPGNVPANKGNGAPPAPKAEPKPEPKAVTQPKTAAPAPQLVVAEPPAPMVTIKPAFFKPAAARPFMERKRGQCAWPISVGGDLMACCDPVSPRSGGREWCEHHTRQGQVSPNTKQKQKARGEIDRRTGAMRQWA